MTRLLGVSGGCADWGGSSAKTNAEPSAITTIEKARVMTHPSRAKKAKELCSLYPETLKRRSEESCDERFIRSFDTSPTRQRGRRVQSEGFPRWRIGLVNS